MTNGDFVDPLQIFQKVRAKKARKAHNNNRNLNESDVSYSSGAPWP
jgi:hypothetical protein